MLIATSSVGYFLIFSGELNDLGKHGISAILSFANIAMWRIPGGYWGTAAENSLFLHTWSLSVEEQFYFIYPFFIVSLLRVARQWVFPAMLAIALCSFLLYLYCLQHDASAAFYLLPTREWELATGCLTAIGVWNRDFTIAKSTSSVLSLIGLTMVLLSYLSFLGDNRFPGLLVLPVIGSAFIIIFGENQSSITNKILTSSFLVFIGKISYSLYLWHWPFLVMARQLLVWDGKASSLLFLFALILLVSIISYYFVEKTTRHRPDILKPVFCLFILSFSHLFS